MPLYEYECVKCGRRTEKIESVSGPHLRKCPHCGGKVEPLVSAPAIQFKGSGWYVTDYAGKAAASEGNKEGNKDEKPAAEKKEASAESVSKESQAKETTTKEKNTEKTAKKK